MKHLLSMILMLTALLLTPTLSWAGVNVNTATSAELQTLPGIGPSKANAIVEYRSANGPFESLGQLDAVPGIGPATLSNLAPLVEFGAGAATAPATEQTDQAVEPPHPPVPPLGAGAVDINSASAAQLTALPGIGAAKAQAIIEDRDTNGAYESCQDLTRVAGIGQTTVSNMGAGCQAN